MQLEFKKWNIKTDGRCFILEKKGTFYNRYYSSFKSALNNIPDKSLLKGEQKTKEEILAELKSIKKEIQNLKL